MDAGTLFSIFFTLGDIVTVIDLLYMGEKREEDSGMKFSCSWLLLSSGGMVEAIDVTIPYHGPRRVCFLFSVIHQLLKKHG